MLVTDESGDDGGDVEEARQTAVSNSVPLYVIGRQSLFGYDRAHLRYIDPVTKDYLLAGHPPRPRDRRLEILQWDGLHDRWDEQPSGFAPYELARLAKDTGGIYFLLPSEENMRVRQREKAYSMQDPQGIHPRLRQPRSSTSNSATPPTSAAPCSRSSRAPASFRYRRHFPIDIRRARRRHRRRGVPVVAAAAQTVLLAIEERLRSPQEARDREPDKRWQAHYDLMLAQIVAYQVKAYEYLACLDEMVALAQTGRAQAPARCPTPTSLASTGCSTTPRDRKAPKPRPPRSTPRPRACFKQVIADHPNTPWADLAQDELDRGFGVQRNEWHHNPKYDERAKLVPKY